MASLQPTYYNLHVHLWNAVALYLKITVKPSPYNLSYTESTDLVPRMHSANTVLKCLPYAHKQTDSVSFVIEASFSIKTCSRNKFLLFCKLYPDCLMLYELH